MIFVVDLVCDELDLLVDWELLGVIVIGYVDELFGLCDLVFVVDLLILK